MLHKDNARFCCFNRVLFPVNQCYPSIAGARGSCASLSSHSPGAGLMLWRKFRFGICGGFRCVVACWFQVVRFNFRFDPQFGFFFRSAHSDAFFGSIATASVLT